jgi:hypothetical protein
VLKVKARIDSQKADVNAIYSELETGAMKDLGSNFPGLSITIGQECQEQQAMTEALGGCPRMRLSNEQVPMGVKKILIF